MTSGLASRFFLMLLRAPAVAAALIGLALSTTQGQTSDVLRAVGSNVGGGTYPAASDSTARDTEGLRIMTWNIRYDNPDDGIHAWPRRRDDLLSFLRSRNIDVLCIQEGLHDQVRFLEEGLPGFDVRGVGRDDGKEKGEYAAIYFSTARLAVGADGTFWLSATPSVPSKGWDAALPRIVTWVRLVDRTTAKTLYVFNTHFDHQGVQARENSARLLRMKTDEIAGSFPVVVAGDFNAIDTDPPYRILTSPDLPSPPLMDAMRRSLEPARGPSATFTGFEATDPVTGPRIDYVFVSESVRVLRYSTFVPLGTNGILSDHLPVVVELLIPPNR